MLQEAKKALRVTAEAYDSEIMDLLKAGAKELEIAGIAIPGTVGYTVDSSGNVTDTSTLRDPLIQRALFTYARMYFGSPADFDRLERAYNTQKVQLMHAGDYTQYEDGEALW